MKTEHPPCICQLSLFNLSIPGIHLFAYPCIKFIFTRCSPCFWCMTDTTEDKNISLTEFPSTLYLKYNEMAQIHTFSTKYQWLQDDKDWERMKILFTQTVLRGGTHTHTGRRSRSILGKSSDLNTYIKRLNRTLEMWGFILFIHIQKKTLIFETLI